MKNANTKEKYWFKKLKLEFKIDKELFSYPKNSPALDCYNFAISSDRNQAMLRSVKTAQIIFRTVQSNYTDLTEFMIN
jgi:hypothetical protein